eukprot:4419087-Pleurochrysis_carterae.AAC.3
MLGILDAEKHAQVARKLGEDGHGEGEPGFVTRSQHFTRFSTATCSRLRRPIIQTVSAHLLNTADTFQVSFVAFHPVSPLPTSPFTHLALTLAVYFGMHPRARARTSGRRAYASCAGCVLFLAARAAAAAERASAEEQKSKELVEDVRNRTPRLLRSRCLHVFSVDESTPLSASCPLAFTHSSEHLC